MQPTYSEIFSALGKVDFEVTALLEGLVAQGVLAEQGDRGAQEMLDHACSIVARLAVLRSLEGNDDRYSFGEFVAALRAEIDAKKRKTIFCPPTLAAFEARLARRNALADAAAA